MVKNMNNRYEEAYMFNKDFFGRHWNGAKSLNPTDCYLQDSYHYMYCLIRAAMDNEGVDFILKKMLDEEWSKKNRILVLLALEVKVFGFNTHEQK
jgi:hypothetical protein